MVANKGVYDYRRRLFTPGHVAEVTGMLLHKSVNIAPQSPVQKGDVRQML